MNKKQYDWKDIKLLINNEEIDTTDIKYDVDEVKFEGYFMDDIRPLGKLMPESFNIVEILKKNEEKVIKDVLRMLLNRQPTTDDARRCTRIFAPGIIDKYLFAYEGVVYGRVTYNSFSVTFYPLTDEERSTNDPISILKL